MTLGLIPVDRQPPPDRPVDIAVVGEILADIVTATVAGQRYLMGKTIAFLAREIAASRVLTERHRSVFARWLVELTRQAERIVPDSRAFNRRARILADILAVAHASERREVRIGPRPAARS